MTIDEACKELDREIRASKAHWYTCCGADKSTNTISIYVKNIKTFEKASHAIFRNGYGGYHVIVRHMGTPRPIGSFMPEKT